MNNMEKEFVDESGEKAKIEIMSNDNVQVNMGRENYKIAESMRMPKRKIRQRGIFTSNIGPGSHGFAQVFTLASIIALGSVIVAFIVLRF